MLVLLVFKYPIPTVDLVDIQDTITLKKNIDISEPIFVIISWFFLYL